MGVDINNVDELLDQKEFIFGTVEGSITENLLKYSDVSMSLFMIPSSHGHFSALQVIKHSVLD